MLKLSNTTRNAALATVLGVGLAGSAAVMMIPAAVQAQVVHRAGSAAGFRGDRDVRGDRDDRFRGDFDDRFRGRDFDDRFRVGVGLGFFPYYYPYDTGYYAPYGYYDYGYGPYCSDYDYANGYCTY